MKDSKILWFFAGALMSAALFALLGTGATSSGLIDKEEANGDTGRQTQIESPHGPPTPSSQRPRSISLGKSAIEILDSGSAVIPKDLLDMLHVQPWTVDYQLLDEELRKFNLNESQIEELKSTIQQHYNEHLDYERDHAQLIKRGDKNLLLKIPAKEVSQETTELERELENNVHRICGPVANLLIPSLKRGMSSLTADFGRHERFIQVNQADDGKIYYEIADVIPDLDLKTEDFETLKRFAITEFRQASNEVPERFKHLFIDE